MRAWRSSSLPPLLALAACAGSGLPACAPGSMPMTEVRLLFGRDIEGRAPLSEEEWRHFLDEEVTPRFPQGFSVADLAGQWRSAAGVIIREQSKSLLLLVPGGAEDRTRLEAIRDAYRRRFDQESVLLIEAPVCARF